MKLTDLQLEQAREVAQSNPAVKALLEHYEFVTASQVYESYIIRKSYVSKWNQELREKDINLINTGKDAEVHDKAVERAVKWFESQLDFLKDTEAMFSMMTPEERSKVVNDLKVKRQIVDIAL